MSVSVSTNEIPSRLEEQDEVLVLLAMRRTDPGNPTGSPNPDIPNLEVATNGVFLEEMCVQLGFDPTQSYVTVASVTDVEQGSAITIADLVSYQTGGVVEDPPVEG